MDSMYSLGTHRVSRELPGDALRDGSDREKFREEFSIVDDLDALSAVSRFSRTHFDHQGHLEASSGHDCDPDREAEISSAIDVVRPSTLAMIAFRSFGFVTFRITCVLHWLSTFLSTFAARCVMMTSPRPNLRPSEASVRNTFDDATWPTWGQKLWASSTTSIIGGIRPTFRNSNIAVARRFTTSS